MAGHHNLHLVLTDRRFEAGSASRARPGLSEWLQACQPNVVLIGAVMGMILGVLIWGYLTISIIAGIDSLLGESEPRPTAAANAQPAVFDCASFGAVRALSAEDEARFQAQCHPPAVTSTDSPAVQPAAPPQAAAATASNRADCDVIRGTDYLSGEERTWFLQNCVSN